METKFSEAEQEAIKKNSNPRTLHGFIPYRLKMKDFPEYDNFPYNIMFMSYANIDGVNMSGVSLYFPDFSTFKEKGNEQSMIYFNRYSRDWTVEIVYDKEKKSWQGSKYGKGEYKGGGGGGDKNKDGWYMAFTHLTILGLVNGEPVEFSKI